MNNRPVKIIANPSAGGGRALKVLAKAEAYLRQAGASYEVALTAGPNHATELAKEAASLQWPIVAAVGGDGTINEVVQGLVHTDSALAVIPGGTGNDLARSLKIPFDTQAAMQLLTTGTAAAMDCGIETSRTFSAIASVGFPVDVIHHVNTTHGPLKGPFKIFTAVWETIRQLRAFPATIYVDGRKRQIRSIGVFIQNTRYSGGGLMIAPKADPADALFDVVIIHELTKWELLRTLPKVYVGGHEHHPAVEFIHCKQFRLETPEPLPKMFDGELVGFTPLAANISPESLKVMVSESTAAEIARSRKNTTVVWRQPLALGV